MQKASRAVLFLALLVAPVAGRTLVDDKTPVEKVVHLLTELTLQLVKDTKVEQQIYDKYACWCEKTTGRKAAAIDQATADLRALGQSILTLKGQIATLAYEIEELERLIEENLEAQAQATALRQKENAAFQAQTVELKQAIAAMEQAVTVLVKGSSSLLQSSARAVIQDALANLPAAASYKPGQAAALADFLQSGSTYAPQSMTVQGILKDMYETFARDLETSTQNEATANRNFEAFMAEKAAQLKADQEEKAQKESEKAAAEELLASTQQIFDDTTAQKHADIEFFDATKAACEAKHTEFEERDSLRKEELAGINEAVGILTSDEARELFAKAIKPGKETGASDKYATGRDIAPAFLQLDGTAVAGAFSALQGAARKGHSYRLAVLALQVRSSKVGHFEKVLAAIDTMIKTLTGEDKADIQKRDQCKDEYKKIESTVKDLNWKIEKNVARIDKLTQQIERFEEEKAMTIQQIAEVEEHMATITAQREADNAAFLQAKLEDQQAIDLLMAARQAMSKFYKKNEIDMGEVQGSVKGAFVQKEPEFAVSEDQAPEATFSHKGHRKGQSKGIVSILTMIIEDLDDEIKNAMKAEEESQVDYENMMAAAKQLHEDLVNKKVSLEEAIANASQERSDETADKESNEGLLADELAYQKSITPDCDWILGAFEKRAAARAAEMNGLVGAKDYLAGAHTASTELLETGKRGFDDTRFAKVHFLGLRR